jgi:FAD/FMN-containing dehydrogenase
MNCPSSGTRPDTSSSSSSAGGFHHNPTTVAILTNGLSRILGVDKAKKQVRVQAGVRLYEIQRVAAENKLAVPVGTLTDHGDLTIGGVITTSSHGTGLRTASSMVSACYPSVKGTS